MNSKERALKLIEEADWDTIRQMVGFLFDEKTLKLLVWNRVDMIAHCIEHKVYDKAEKELNDFVEFFRIWCDRCEKFYSKEHSCFERRIIECPKCNSPNITNLPSSTLPINDKTETYFGSNIKASKEELRLHKSIKYICSDCGYEFGKPKSELSKKYDEMFKKDIEDIKKKDYIEIDEEKEMKADLKRKYD